MAVQSNIVIVCSGRLTTPSAGRQSQLLAHVQHTLCTSLIISGECLSQAHIYMYTHLQPDVPAAGFAVRPRDAEGVPWKPVNVCPTSQQGSDGARWFVKVKAGTSDDRKTWYFGAYDERAEAARVADRAALVLHGEHAALNLPHQITADERRALIAIQDVAAYAAECISSAPCSQPKSSEFVGVTVKPSGAIKAQIRVCGRVRYLGIFDSSEDAAAAWDEAAVLADIYGPSGAVSPESRTSPSIAKWASPKVHCHKSAAMTAY
jgi:hypothetical protein